MPLFDPVGQGMYARYLVRLVHQMRLWVRGVGQKNNTREFIPSRFPELNHLQYTIPMCTDSQCHCQCLIGINREAYRQPIGGVSANPFSSASTVSAPLARLTTSTRASSCGPVRDMACAGPLVAQCTLTAWHYYYKTIVYYISLARPRS